MQAIGVAGSATHSVDITRDTYRSDSFIVTIDTEKVPQSSFSGTPCNTGALLTFNMKGFGHDDASYCKRAYISCNVDMILQISDQGALLLS